MYIYVSMVLFSVGHVNLPAVMFKMEEKIIAMGR